MLPEGTKRRVVILRDTEYTWMVKLAKTQGRKFSNWAAEVLRRALYESPVGRANAKRWDA
jgi:hypothetical protein